MMVTVKFKLEQMELFALAYLLGKQPYEVDQNDFDAWVQAVIDGEMSFMIRDWNMRHPEGQPICAVKTETGTRPVYAFRVLKKGVNKGKFQCKVKSSLNGVSHFKMVVEKDQLVPLVKNQIGKEGEHEKNAG